MNCIRQIDLDSPDAFINRELSWLGFARRVLELAEDASTPLLERVKFAGIMGTIYDEFAMKRIGGLRRQVAEHSHHQSADGLTPLEELQASRTELKRQTTILCQLVEQELRPALAKAGMPLASYNQLTEAQKISMAQYFHKAVEPILTPLAVDVGHPFPFISNLSINLAVMLHQKNDIKPRFIRIKVPANRPRWVPLPGGGYVPLEQIIANNLACIFPGCLSYQCYFFRITRGAKDDPWDQIPEDDTDLDLEPGSLIGMVSTELTARKFAGAVRLQVSADMPETLQLWIAEQLDLDDEDIVVINGLLAMTDLVKFQPDGYPDLRHPPHRPVNHPRLAHLDPQDTEAIFHEIQTGDILVHHPYHNFDTSTLRFLESAARDPKVLAIKLTIYRTGNNSPIIQALTEAAQQGKQVAVLVEITARFDEAPNIAWGEQLAHAGAHVVYGMTRLKTHVKLGLVVREEPDGLRRYVHVATGNYHSGTARLYEDLGLLTCNPTLGASVAAVFNELTSAVPALTYGDLMVAPHNLRARFTELIHREVAHAEAGRPCGIVAKMNQLQDKAIIQELYRASQARVPIKLNVRGLCCLRAGIADLSPTIQVFSTLGRFLEHSRIYRFENGGKPEYFIGSADWMKRNLDRRMETIMPVIDPIIQAELERILDIYDNDNCSAWDMQPDGNYIRRRPKEAEDRRAAQEVFIQTAQN